MLMEYTELGAYAIFAIIVIGKVLDFLKTRINAPEAIAQNEFYKSFAEFQVEWRAASKDIEKILEITIEEKAASDSRYRELRHGQKNIQNNIQVFCKDIRQ